MGRQNVGNIYASLSLEAAEFMTGLQRAAQQTQKTGAAIERAMNTARAAVQGFLAYFTAEAAIAAVRGYARITDQMASVDAQLKLATSSMVEFQRAQESARKAAQDFGRSYADTASLTAAIARSTESMGLSASQQDEVVRSLMANINISGASAEAVSNAMVQFRQALEGGVMRAEEFTSVNEQVPQVLRAIAEGLGTTSGGLRKMMLDGELTADKIITSLIKVRAESERQAASLPQRWDQTWQRMTDSAALALSEFEKGGQFSRVVNDWVSDTVKGFDQTGNAAFEAGVRYRAALDVLRADREIQSGVSFAETIMRGYFDWQIRAAEGTVKAVASGVDNITALGRRAAAVVSGIKAAWSMTGWDEAAYQREYQRAMDGSSVRKWGENLAKQYRENQKRIRTERDNAVKKETAEFSRRAAARSPAASTIPEPDKKAIAAAKKELDEINRIVDALLFEQAARAENSNAIALLNKALARGIVTADEYALALQRARAAMLDSMGLDKIAPKIADFDANSAIRNGLPKFDQKDLLDIPSIRAGARAIEEARESAERFNQTAMQIGTTMSSSLEDAIFAGRGFKTILGGLLEDLAKMALRFTVLEPLARSFGNALKGGGGGGFNILAAIGSVFGGARANGGPVTAGKTYLVGERGPELFSPGSSGNIIPNGALKGMTGALQRIQIVPSPYFNAVVEGVAQPMVQQGATLAAAGGSAMAQQEMARRARRSLR